MPIASFLGLIGDNTLGTMRTVFTSAIIAIYAFCNCQFSSKDCPIDKFMASKDQIQEELRNHIIGVRGNIVLMTIVLANDLPVVFGFDKDTLNNANRLYLDGSLDSTEKQLLYDNIFNQKTMREFEQELKIYVTRKMQVMQEYEMSSINSNTYKSPIEVFTICSKVTVYHSIKNESLLSAYERNVIEGAKFIENGWYVKRK